MSIVPELLVILALVLANGFFAGAEIAILSVRKTRLRELSDEGHRSAQAMLRMREDPESLFATIQIGITVIGATAAAFGGAKVARGLASTLVPALGPRYAEDVALAGVIGIISFLSIVLGELVPKSLALRSAERLGLLVARPLLVMSRAARPLVWLLTATSNVILRVFHDRTTFTEARLSKDELQQLVDEASTAGALDARVAAIAYRALDFGDVHVRAVMIPRPDMVVLPEDASLRQVRDVLTRYGHARIPVHRDAPDEIIGYVTARDMISVLVSEEPRTIRDVLRAALFVPEVQLAATVLADMQRARKHLALVVDEQGSVVGLVTLEDLLEELVGEIFAEHDTPIVRICRESDGGILVRGRVPVHEINRELGIELPESPDWSTIGGLATALAGSLPAEGARLTTTDGTTLEVVETSERGVQRVRIRTARGPEKLRALG